MNDNVDFIYCDRCGNKMRADQRCCIKCGNINFLNQDNQSMEKFAKKAEQSVLNNSFVKNKFIKDSAAIDSVMYADKAGNRGLCLLFNFIIYVISLFILFVFGKNSIPAASYNYVVAILFVVVTYIHFILLAMQLVYMKANKRWWAVFVPFYDLFQWFDITMGNGWLSLLSYIPFVGSVFLLISFYKMGEKFGKNKLLCLIFPYIMIIILAFGIDVYYKGVNFIFSKKDKEKTLSREYKVNNFIIKYVLLITIIVGGVFGYNYINLKLKNYFIENVNIIVDYVEEKVEKGAFVCSTYNSNGILYFKFDNASSDFNCDLPARHDVILNRYSGYIKVVKDGDGYKYYASVTNGLYGVVDVEFDTLDSSDVSFIKDIYIDINDGLCNVY